MRLMDHTEDSVIDMNGSTDFTELMRGAFFTVGRLVIYGLLFLISGCYLNTQEKTLGSFAMPVQKS